MNMRRHMLIPGGSVGALSQSGILAPRSCLSTPALQKMQVQPEICMKTKDRENAQAPRRADSGRFSWSFVPEWHSGSSLLAPVSRLLHFKKMKVQPEMLLKTHDRQHGTRDTGRVDSSLCPPRNAGPPVQQGAPAPVTGYPGNMLKTKVRQNPITHHKSPFANALSPDSALQRMKVQPEMLLKTHDRPPSAGRET